MELTKLGLGFARASLGPLLAVGYVWWLVATAPDLGYARDEGFYFYAASRYQAWFELLWSNPARALEAAVLDYHWSVNHEHPAFIKTLLALAQATLYERLAWFDHPGTAYRFVGMLMAGVALVTVYAWCRRLAGAWSALVALAALGLMPRLFFHAHMSCFDVPVATLWLLTVFAYARCLSDSSWRAALLAGLVFGLLLNTKHNAWLLPPVLLVHWLLTGAYRARDRAWLSGASKALVCMALLGPLVCWATWPWLWRDGWQRWLEYARFHLGHEYYNMEFLGHTYYKPPMPRLYAWLMTLATVPLTTLALAGVGGVAALVSIARSGLFPKLVQRLAGHWPRVRTLTARAVPPDAQHAASVQVLWALCVLGSYAPWLSSATPIFGGTKHWLTAYPFLALFAGMGFRWLSVGLGRGLAEFRFRRALPLVLALVLLAPSFSMTLDSHPYGLSAYTPIVGGAPGAATLGLNRGFWGYTTGALEGFINDRAAGGATLYLHDTARQSFAMLQRDGRIRPDIVPTLDIRSSDMALYHHEPHMSRVEYQIWVEYGTLRPAAMGVFQGVPVVWAYRRPPGPRSQPK